MSQRRNELDAVLREVLGSSNVYFQPPEGTKMKYPCIVYRYSAPNDIPADNLTYRRLHQYSLTYITKDPDDPKRDQLNDLRYCRFVQFFTSDNLNHYVYTIYH